MEPASHRRPKTDASQRRDLARLAARSRWGAPHKVRLDGLNEDERWAVHRLVEVLLAAKAMA